MSLRVLVAEDHSLVAQGLEQMLSMVQNIEIVGVVDSGEQAVAYSQKDRVDIVLLGVKIGRKCSMSGIEATRLIKEQTPETKVLVLTMFTDPGTVAEAVKAGADGYLSKGASGESVPQAIYDVNDGRAVIDPNVTAGISRKLRFHDRTQWRFDPFDPRTQIMLPLLFLGVVVAFLLWRFASIGS